MCVTFGSFAHLFEEALEEFLEAYDQNIIHMYMDTRIDL